MGYPALDLSTVADYAAGCEVLGSGGGGAPAAMMAALTNQLRNAELPLVRELPADAQVVAVSVMGSPLAFAERLPSGKEFGIAADLLRQLGMPSPTVIVSVETAGMNGTFVASLAEAQGLPLLDADLMGRALPTLNQVSVAPSVAMGPAVLATPSGEAVLVRSESIEFLERLLRAALPECGGWGLLVTRPFRTQELAGRVVAGTVSRAIELGRSLRTLPEGASAREVAQAVHGRLLGSGVIEQVQRHPRRGSFAGGDLYLTDSSSGRVVRVEYQNEYLLAAIDGEVVVTCPDLLIVLHPRSRRLIPPDGLRPRMPVAVVGLEGPSWWKAHPDRLARVGPRAFGLDQEPVLWKAA